MLLTPVDTVAVGTALLCCYCYLLLFSRLLQSLFLFAGAFNVAPGERLAVQERNGRTSKMPGLAECTQALKIRRPPRWGGAERVGFMMLSLSLSLICFSFLLFALDLGKSTKAGL